MEKLTKALGYIMGVILTVVILTVCAVMLFDIVVGAFELAWWFITGEFFHFVNIEPPKAF